MVTELKKGTAAIIWHPEDGFSLMLPDENDETNTEPEQVLLTAIVMRIISDEEFVKEQMSWFETRKNDKEEP